MKFGRGFMGGMLAILGLFGYLKNNTNSELDSLKLIGDNGYVSKNTVNYGNQVFDENKENVEVIEYTNKFNYPVELKESDIILNCIGSGNSKEDDEELAQKNYHIKAKFSKNKNGEKMSSLLVPEKSKAYIFVVSEYDGDKPINPVSCEYSLSISI